MIVCVWVKKKQNKKRNTWARHGNYHQLFQSASARSASRTTMISVSVEKSFDRIKHELSDTRTDLSNRMQGKQIKCVY